MKYCYYDGKGTPDHGFCECDFCKKRKEKKGRQLTKAEIDSGIHASGKGLFSDVAAKPNTK